MTEENKPKVKLVGEDGNIFAVVGKCLRAAKKAGWTVDQRSAFTSEVDATESYNKALAVVQKYFEVE